MYCKNVNYQIVLPYRKDYIKWKLYKMETYTTSPYPAIDNNKIIPLIWALNDLLKMHHSTAFFFPQKTTPTLLPLRNTLLLFLWE